MLIIRTDRLESTVLDGLRERLMDPELFETFAAEFTREWNLLQAEASGEMAARQSELARVNAQLERLVDALVAGTPVSAVKNRMDSLEERRIALEAELATLTVPAPRLHPNVAVVYREKVAELTSALAKTDSAKLRNLVRALVDEIRLVPEEGSLRIELRGELAAILGLGCAGNGNVPAMRPRRWLCKLRWLRGQDLNL